MKLPIKTVNRGVLIAGLLSIFFHFFCVSEALAQNSDGLLRVFSNSNTPVEGSFDFSATNATDLSGSNWGFGVDEGSVYHAALKHQQAGGVANRDWEVRIGSGGQIYSIRSEFGEIVPPQSLGRHFMDEVFQSISVDTTPRDQGNQAAFYHQSGYYTDGDNVNGPTYAPLLASGAVEANSYSTLSLAVQADTNSDPQIPAGLLNYQRTRDLGDGVIEITHSIYNFGGNTVDFHNLPWGGVRKTKLDHMLVSNSGGGYTERDIDRFRDFENQIELAENTNGWAAFAEGTDGTSRGIAYVFGDDDTHLNEQWQTSKSSWRWGDGGGDILGLPVRNFNVGTFRRFVDINPGELFESRYFLVLGDVDHIASTIEDRGLSDDAIYDILNIGEGDSAELAWRIESDNNGITVLETSTSESNFRTYAEPVQGSKPLFLIEDADGRQYLSVDPYALNDSPWNGETTYRGILGFVLPEDLAASNGPYVDLDSLFPQSYFLNTSPSINFVALQGNVAVPEPAAVSMLMLLLVGLVSLRQRRLFSRETF